MPVHATSPSKVSTSLQPKGGTNPIIERPATLSLLPLLSLFLPTLALAPAILAPCAHLMQLLQRVSNASRGGKAQSIFIGEFALRLGVGNFSSERSTVT